MVDIYFEPNYGKLYEEMESGESIVYTFEHDYGKIQHMFIKREIPYSINNHTYFDSVTPYGYGGPVILEVTEGKERELVEAFEKEFEKYCIENDIVSEFVRFHPIVGNYYPFKEVYNAYYMRKTVATSIEQNVDPMASEFSKSTRKTIRRALRNGVTYKITPQPDDISVFLKIYYSTMDRNEASDYYYFDDEYFEKSLESFKENILLVEVLYEEQVISMGFYFIYNDIIHAHLSGTLTNYMNFSPAYVIKYATAEWASKNNIKLIHYGGGTTNSPENSLYKFKKRFTKDTEFDFYIGKRIWNNDIYNKLCEERNVDKNIDYFPAYRFDTSE